MQGVQSNWKRPLTIFQSVESMRLRKIDLPPEVSDDTMKAFLRLYQLETWIREMVYLELRAYYGMNWWNEAENALKRARVPINLTGRYVLKDKKHPHISTHENDPLWFISFDSLLKIIFDAKLWKLFGTYFTTKKLLRVRFEEILPIRNRVAHCRGLHAYDVDRLSQFMRDFDQGFWRFCTSYGDRYVFVDRLSNNDVFKYFRTSQTQNLDLHYSARPYVQRRKPQPQLGADFIYDITITSRYPGRFFEYERILSATRSLHKFAIHIMLDSFQHSLRVTFPGTLDSATIIGAVERFVSVAHNSFSIAPLVNHVDVPQKEDPEAYWVQHEAWNRPFEQIASLWPHYVVAPSHPYTFIDSSCPCSFFGV